MKLITLAILASALVIAGFCGRSTPQEQGLVAIIGLILWFIVIILTVFS